MLLGINKKEYPKLFLAFFLFLGLLMLGFYLELTGKNTHSEYLIFKTILAASIVGIFFLLQRSTQLKVRRILRWFTFFWVGAFLLNIGLNLINVYSLGQNQLISSFCAVQTTWCKTAVEYFYTLKLFRFITLSSYFFLFPLFIPFGVKLGRLFPKEIKKYHRVQKVFLAIILILVATNLAQSVQTMYLSMIHSVQVRNENFYDRFIFKQGGISYYGWIRVYSNFILAETNQTAGILVPPQSLEYIMEGNTNYFRWFLYPRPLYHLEQLENGIESNQVNFVILSAGECDSHQCVWPNFEIPAKRIEYIATIDRETQQVTKLKNVGYTPAKYQNKWGIMKLK